MLTEWKIFQPVCKTAFYESKRTNSERDFFRKSEFQDFEQAKMGPLEG